MDRENSPGVIAKGERSYRCRERVTIAISKVIIVVTTMRLHPVESSSLDMESLANFVNLLTNTQSIFYLFELH